MNQRHAVVLANEDFGGSGTKIIDFDVDDPVSAITIKHQPVGGSNTPVAHPAKNVEKIELVDGSDVLFGLTGTQCQALNVFESPKVIQQIIDFRTGGTPMTNFQVNFGRFLWDPRFLLMPKEFKNLKLKITWNETNYDASCGSHGFIIFAHIFDWEKVNPLGFLMSKEIKAYEPTAGAYEYSDLPVDYPIRAVMVQGMKAGGGIRSIMETIKLSEDTDKRVIIEGDVDELRAFLDLWAGDCADLLTGNVGASSINYFVTPHNVFSHASDGDTLSRVIASGLPIGGRLWVIAETGTTGFATSIRGKNPHGCVTLPFGRPTVPATWWKPKGVKSLKLRVKGGGSATTGDEVAIVTQQLRRY